MSSQCSTRYSSCRGGGGGGGGVWEWSSPASVSWHGLGSLGVLIVSVSGVARTGCRLVPRPGT